MLDTILSNFLSLLMSNLTILHLIVIGLIIIKFGSLKLGFHQYLKTSQLFPSQESSIESLNATKNMRANVLQHKTTSIIIALIMADVFLCVLKILVYPS